MEIQTRKLGKIEMKKREITGKTVRIERQPMQLFGAFEDLTLLAAALPEDKRGKVKVTADTIEGEVQGFKLGVRISRRVPFSLVEFEGMDGGPFPFSFALHFDSAGDGMTDFHIFLFAELNTMLDMMLGGMLQKVVDEITDKIAQAASGVMPDIPGM